MRILARQSLLSTTYCDRIEKKMALVYQPCPKLERCQLGTETVRSLFAEDFIFWISAKSRGASILVLALDTDPKVFEKTTLSAAREISAKSMMTGRRSTMNHWSPIRPSFRTYVDRKDKYQSDARAR